jgi:N-acetylneuraminate synthase
MNPKSWREMVDRTRELENALGSGVKQVEENERETVVIQRRAICAREKLAADTVLSHAHLTVLRPCPSDGLPPYCIDKLIGKQLRRDVSAGEHLRWIDLE